MEPRARARGEHRMVGVWMLDRGLIHRPDHAVVLVYLASNRGPCWMPIDPSQDRLSSAQPAEPTRDDLLRAAVDLVLGPGFAGEPEPALLARLESPRRLELLLRFLAGSRYVRALDSDLRWLIDEGW
jgi:hypothetical protein